MRKLLIGMVAVAVVEAIGLWALLRPWPSAVPHLAHEQIERGMTPAEVHLVLGCPPGDYSTRPIETDFFCCVVDRRSPRRSEYWLGDEGLIDVKYGQVVAGQEAVMAVRFYEARPNKPDPIRLARWRLKRLKERWLP